MIFASLCILALVGLARAEVLVLTQDNFKSELEKHKNLFIKFYAPWCGHCKRLAPVWEEMSGEFSVMPVAEVDCTTHTEICGKYGVNGYPTIKLLQSNGAVMDYDGPREKQDMMQWAEAMLKPALTEYNDINDIKEKASQTSQPDIYYVMEGPQLLDKFEDFFTPMKGKHFFGFIKSAKEKLYVMREGVRLDFKGKFDKASVQAFLQDNRFPFFPELGPSNFQDLLKRPGRLLTFLAIDPSEHEDTRSKLASFARKLQTGAADLDSKFVSDYYTLTSIDGVQWAQFMEQFEIKKEDLPQLVVYDVLAGSKKYFKAAIGDSVVEDVTAFLRKHKSGATPPSYIDKEEAKAAKKTAQGEEYTPSGGNIADRIMDYMNTMLTENFALFVAMILIGSAIVMSLLIGCCCTGKKKRTPKKSPAKAVKKDNESTDQKQSPKKASAVNKPAQERRRK